MVIQSIKHNLVVNCFWLPKNWVIRQYNIIPPPTPIIWVEYLYRLWIRRNPISFLWRSQFLTGAFSQRQPLDIPDLKEILDRVFLWIWETVKKNDDWLHPWNSNPLKSISLIFTFFSDSLYHLFDPHPLPLAQNFSSWLSCTPYP